VLIKSNYLKVFKISVGLEETPTPSGIFQICERWPYPDYKTKDGKVFKGSKNNMTGIGAMLYVLADLKGRKIIQSIHGFVDNWKHRQSYVKVHTLNYTQESSGCVRMSNSDILDLDAKIKIGEIVAII